MSAPLRISTPSVTPGSLRWAGLLLIACAVLSLGVTVHVAESGPGPFDVLALVATLLAAVGVMAAALVLPWRRWPHQRSLGLAVAALFVMLLARFATGYTQSHAAATYPLFITLVLAWVGVSQPRRTALSFALCAGAVLAVVVLSDPSGALSLGALVVVLPAGAALGEAASWIMTELRRLQRHDEQRATAFIDLTRDLHMLPERTSRAEVATALAHASARVFATRAEVTLIDTDGIETTAAHGVAPVEPVADAAAAGRALRRSHPERDLGPLATLTLLPALGGDGSDDHGPSGGDTATGLRPRRTTITLTGQRGILGRVLLDLSRNPDDTYLTNLVRLFGTQASAALERFELLTRLDHESTHDELTGIGNRRQATRLLASLRNGDGVLLIDVDGFKAINDSAGHLAGDDLLRRLGNYLNSYVRGGDEVARLGGDEFVIVVRGVGDAVTSAAARLLDGWRAIETTATVSIGVAVHRGGEEPSASLDRADRALYEAKRSGRDQVAISPL